MKKEKKIRTYQRRTKSGKLVTVKAHTAKYDAAEHARELAKRKGAGDELEERKKKSSAQLELPFAKEDESTTEEVKETTAETTKRKAKAKEPKTSEPKPKAKSKTKEAKPTSEPAFTAAEFKEWYRGTGSAADKRVAKALRAQLGRSGYKKLEDEAIDSYSARGHLSMFKRVSSEGGVKEKVVEAKVPKSSKDSKTSSKVEESKKKPATLHPHDYYEYTPSVRKKLDSLEAKIKEGDAVWRSKFGSGRKGSVAERDKFLRGQNKLRDQYTRLLDSSTTETDKYKKYKKDLHSHYESERAREKESERATKREKMQRNKSLYEKYGTTRKEVADYMRSGSRKWKWDSESDAFIAKTNKNTGRVYDSMSLERAIKRMMKAKAVAGSTEPKPKAKSKEGKGVNVGEGKPKSKKTEPDPWEEHVKSQVSALKHLERTTTRLEESLRTAKSTHSKLWANDPKRMRYAKRIQNLQQKLADTKEALEHQRQRVEDVTKPSKTSVKKPYTAPTHKPSKKVIESMTTGKDWIYGD